MADDLNKNKTPDLGRLEAELRKLKVPPMTQNETARFYARLDSALDNAEIRTGWFNRVFLRWGAVGAAMIVLVGMSFVTGLKYAQNGIVADVGTVSDYTASDDQITEDTELDDKYVDMLISSQVQSYGYDISDDILGEISDDELQMLNEAIDVGALL
jgi:hypothetical protein